MKVDDADLARLKRATEDALRRAEAYGDPIAIAEAKRNDDLVADLVRRNGQLTIRDVGIMATLIDRVIAFANWLMDPKNWPDWLD